MELLLREMTTKNAQRVKNLEEALGAESARVLVTKWEGKARVTAAKQEVSNEKAMELEMVAFQHIEAMRMQEADHAKAIAEREAGSNANPNPNPNPRPSQREKRGVRRFWRRPRLHMSRN